MFATAYCAFSGSSAARQANVPSTMYSGSTAIRASRPSASPAETSTWSASAAHDSRNAAPTMANPNRSARAVGEGWKPPSSIVSPGTVTAAAIAIGIVFLAGWAAGCAGALGRSFSFTAALLLVSGGPQEP